MHITGIKYSELKLSRFYNIEDLLDINDIINKVCSDNQKYINFYWLGIRDYNPIWKLQRKLHELRINHEINDIVLLLEHNHVYTLGKHANEDHILPSKPTDTDIIKIDRGGDVTYHGPGQLVGYPIIDLHSYKMSITWYIRLLSNSIIDLLKEINIDSYYKKDYIGIWVEEEKIAAFGVRLAKWVTMHGFALNIDTDLNYFNGMIPCGIFEHGITSIKEITNQKFKVEELAIMYSKYFLKHLNKEVGYETT